MVKPQLGHPTWTLDAGDDELKLAGIGCVSSQRFLDHLNAYQMMTERTTAATIVNTLTMSGPADVLSLGAAASFGSERQTLLDRFLQVK